MQFFKPENDFTVREALVEAGRADLIGGCDGLIPAQPPKEAIEAWRMQADTAGQAGHYHSGRNPGRWCRRRRRARVTSRSGRPRPGGSSRATARRGYTEGRRCDVTATDTQLLLEGGAEQQPGWPEAQAEALRALQERLPDVPMPSFLSWRLTPAWPDRVEIAMWDQDWVSELPVRRLFKRKWLDRPDTRNLCHLEVLSQLTHIRSRLSSKRVDLLVQELQRQEATDAGQDHR